MIVSYFMWVLGIELCSSAREIYTLDHRAVSLALVVLPNGWFKGKVNVQRNNLSVRTREARRSKGGGVGKHRQSLSQEGPKPSVKGSLPAEMKSHKGVP